MVTLTFLIPVRHQDNSRDWPRLKANLAQTVRSIAAQTNGDWRGIIIANEGADLPPLPEGFSVEWVQFAANPQHEKGRGGATEEFLDAFRRDKGRRVLKGLLRARDSRFIMVVDDDDFVSARITQFVADHRDTNGWTIDLGYVWNDGGALLYQHRQFNHVCGSSLIVRTDLYRMPDTFESATADFITDMLGSHRQIARLLAERGTPLSPLPFPGAIYRVGHPNSHSRTPRLLRKYVFNAGMLRRPREMLGNLFRLRRVGAAARQEFFGAACPPSRI
jgi:hypothetical protein